MIPQLTKFEITDRNVSLRDTSISRDDFIEAILEYFRIIDNHRFKIGDFMSLYKRRYPNRDMPLLLQTLLKRTTYKQSTLYNAMSLAEHYPPDERDGDLPPSQYHTLQSLRDLKFRKKIMADLKTAIKAGHPLSDTKLREIVREAKIRSGQGVGKQGRRWSSQDDA